MTTTLSSQTYLDKLRSIGDQFPHHKGGDVTVGNRDREALAMVITCMSCLQPLSKPPSTFLGLSSSSSLLQNLRRKFQRRSNDFKCRGRRRVGEKRRGVIVCGLPLPVDPWAPSIDSQSIASQLFAFSLFPYIGFLYFITKSKSAPKLTLFGFYFLLAFVGATSEFSTPFSFPSVLF